MSQIVIGVPLLPGESLGDASAFGECELVSVDGAPVFGVRHSLEGGVSIGDVMAATRALAQTAQRIGMQLTDEQGAERVPWVWGVE